jgi:predicted transcriptional regulator
MAKTRVTKVPAVHDDKTAKPVRLDLTLADHERLERLASARGLSKSSYARQAVLKQMKADEREDAE